MSSLLPVLNLPAGITGYSGVVGFAFVAALFVVLKLSQPSKLDAIPTAGSTSWLGTWLGGSKSLTNTVDAIQEGYEKYKRAPFKVLQFHGWMVVLSSPEHMEELRRAPDDTLSFLEGTNEQLQVEYMVGPGIHNNPYHIRMLRSKLTPKHFGPLYPEVTNEIIAAFDDILDLKANEWKNVPALSSVQKIVCRTSNRLFVGLPLCRDPDWIALNIQYTLDVVRGASILRSCPTFLKPFITRFFTKVSQGNHHGRNLLGPMIEERQKCLNEYGNQCADKTNDLLTWLIEAAEGPELTIKSLTTRMLFINFAAIHTTSVSFTNALFYLAANTQYIRPLREEVEVIVQQAGWTSVALGKMHKVDSFLKECERMEGFNGVSLIRKAVKDFTFSDGTFVPKGTMLVAASRSVHYDDAIYPNAHAFEPFRFADLREEGGEDSKHHFVSTATEYLAFGHGRHACPGRLFAAHELKSMLAHVLVMYDVKLVDNAKHPQRLIIGTSTLPDPNARVMFRKRIN